MKWLVLILMVAGVAVLGPLLLLLAAASFVCCAVVAGLQVLAESRRGPHVYDSRQ